MAQGKRILVVYASGHGATAGVARQIAQSIAGTGVQVDVMPVETAADPAGYDAVVIGSAIRFDTWLPAAKAYVLAHEAALSSRPVAYFLTCMALSIPTGAAQGAIYADRVAALSPAVRPRSVGQFAGALDFARFALLYRLPARLLFSFLGAKSGDYRDFDAIHHWALQCCDLLLPATLESET